MSVIVDDSELRIEKMELGPFGTNAYIVVEKSSGESLLIDAPASPDTILAGLEGTRPGNILLTHSHFDHTGALDSLRSVLRVPLAAHRADSSILKKPPETYLEDGDNVSLGSLRLGVLHTPGHTPGSLCFRLGKYLFAGDTLFPGGPGKTSTPDDFLQIIESITGKIYTLEDDTRVLPGHGDETAVGQSRQEYAVFAARPHEGICGDVTWNGF